MTGILMTDDVGVRHQMGTLTLDPTRMNFPRHLIDISSYRGRRSRGSIAEQVNRFYEDNDIPWPRSGPEPEHAKSKTPTQSPTNRDRFILRHPFVLKAVP